MISKSKVTVRAQLRAWLSIFDLVEFLKLQSLRVADLKRKRNFKETDWRVDNAGYQGVG